MYPMHCTTKSDILPVYEERDNIQRKRHIRVMIIRLIRKLWKYSCTTTNHYENSYYAKLIARIIEINAATNTVIGNYRGIHERNELCHIKISKRIDNHRAAVTGLQPNTTIMNVMYVVWVNSYTPSLDDGLVQSVTSLRNEFLTSRQ